MADGLRNNLSNMSSAAKPAQVPPAFSPEFEAQTYARVTWRLIPFLFLCYIFAYLDRVNVSFAALQMRQDLGLSDAVYGVAAGIFFVGYFFFEVPCNLALQKIGAKYWLGPIMMVWGVVSACTLFVKTAHEFYAIRFLLGIVESGFFPGVILYLTFWFPSRRRAKMIASFMTAIPLAGVIGGPISGWILDKAGSLGVLRGWQWLYLIEAVPSIIAGVATLIFLQDKPSKAKWLSEDERLLLDTRLQEDDIERRAHGPKRHSLTDAFKSGKTWLLCAVYFGFVIGNYGLSFFLPEIIKDTLTKDPFQIGLLTVIPYSLAAIAMVLVGHRSDKTGERRWHIALTGLIAVAGFVVSAFPVSGVGVFIALTIATAANACAYSTFWALPTLILSGTAAAAGIAWINSVGNLAGYFGPSVMGYSRTSLHSTTPALLFIAAIILISSLITIIFFKPRHEPTTVHN